MMFKKKVVAKQIFDTGDFKVGDVVEYLRKGEWIVGEVQESDYDGRTVVWPLKGNNYCNFGECKLRQTSDTIKKAKKHYKNLVQQYTDIIDHKNDKKYRSEAQDKLTALNDLVLKELK